MNKLGWKPKISPRNVQEMIEEDYRIAKTYFLERQWLNYFSIESHEKVFVQVTKGMVGSALCRLRQKRWPF